MGATIAQSVTNAIRPPAVAGQFYPAGAVRLRRVITAYLEGLDKTFSKFWLVRQNKT